MGLGVGGWDPPRHGTGVNIHDLRGQYVRTYIGANFELAGGTTAGPRARTYVRTYVPVYLRTWSYERMYVRTYAYTYVCVCCVRM